MSAYGMVVLETWGRMSLPPVSTRQPQFERPPTMADVVGAASRMFGVHVDELVGFSRVRPLMGYRQASMAACRQLTGSSYQSIAHVFGDRDHCTVMAAVARARTDRELSSLTGRLVDVVKGSYQ